jgi:ABC-type lipoprotein export system ATPase subunit
VGGQQRMGQMLQSFKIFNKFNEAQFITLALIFQGGPTRYLKNGTYY